MRMGVGCGSHRLARKRVLLFNPTSGTMSFETLLDDSPADVRELGFVDDSGGGSA